MWGGGLGESSRPVQVTEPIPTRAACWLPCGWAGHVLGAEVRNFQGPRLAAPDTTTPGAHLCWPCPPPPPSPSGRPRTSLRTGPHLARVRSPTCASSSRAPASPRGRARFLSRGGWGTPPSLCPPASAPPARLVRSPHGGLLRRCVTPQGPEPAPQTSSPENNTENMGCRREAS